MTPEDSSFGTIRASLPAMLHARFVPVPGTRWLLGLQLLVGSLLPLFAQSDQPVYTDSLQNGWANWSWATVNFNNASPVHSGTSSISVTCTNNQALYLHHTAFDSTPYTNLTFWINGGAGGGQPLKVQATANTIALPNYYTISPLSQNSWQLITVPLSALGVAGMPNMDGFWIQSTTASQLAPFYVDDITLVAGTTPPVTNTPVSITVDAQSNRHPISPLIYGVAFAGSSSQLSDLNSPIHRSGGNSETSYNWQLNAHNHAADWYFESIDDGSATPAASADSFVSTSKTGGAEPMLTIPMIGWVPKLGPSRGKLGSYSIAKYGPQTGNDAAYFADAGNGISSTNGNKPITWNDPNDANFATNSTFQQVFVQHLTNRWGLSTNGGVRYYLMDNEHSLWQSTHQDVHPVGPTMQEIRDKIFDYAGKVKAVDPAALVAAPEEWGWSGYFYSGYDQQYGAQHNWTSFPDRAANGGMDYMPWLLSQLYQRATNTNQRLLDYFTLHCYPQSGEFSQTDVSTAMQLLRNRSTRQFWDTNYVDASWINSVVMLIPRMKNWVATYYPGTKIGITEYNWGAEGFINGATAQADIYGIFGREGLDLATRWTTPAPGTPTYNAMKMYRNYDGSDSGFGDSSVSAAGPNPDNLSTFAAQRSSDGALTVMVINKQLGVSATAGITVTNRLLSGAGQVWQLTSANAITRLGDISFTGNKFTNTVPPQSITLFVLPAGTTPPPPALRPGSLSRTNTFDLWLDGTSGQRYVLQSTSDLRSWAPVATNTLSGSSWHILLPASNVPQTFYRGLWAP
jgi:hypothetical protein